MSKVKLESITFREASKSSIELTKVSMHQLTTPLKNKLKVIQDKDGMQIEVTFDGNGIGISLSAHDAKWLLEKLNEHRENTNTPIYSGTIEAPIIDIE